MLKQILKIVGHITAGIVIVLYTLYIVTPRLNSIEVVNKRQYEKSQLDKKELMEADSILNAKLDSLLSKRK